MKATYIFEKKINFPIFGIVEINEIIKRFTFFRYLLIFSFILYFMRNSKSNFLTHPFSQEHEGNTVVVSSSQPFIADRIYLLCHNWLLTSKTREYLDTHASLELRKKQHSHGVRQLLTSPFYILSASPSSLVSLSFHQALKTIERSPVQRAKTLTAKPYTYRKRNSWQALQYFLVDLTSLY